MSQTLIGVLVSSPFVVTALTLTGLAIRNSVKRPA
jgi:hypothetical protein